MNDLARFGFNFVFGLIGLLVILAGYALFYGTIAGLIVGALFLVLGLTELFPVVMTIVIIVAIGAWVYRDYTRG